MRVKGYDGSLLVMLVQKLIKVLSDPAVLTQEFVRELVFKVFVSFASLQKRLQMCSHMVINIERIR